MRVTPIKPKELGEGLARVGKQAVMADAVEFRRQNMNEEAADELVCRQGHGLLPRKSLGPVVPPFESDSLVVTGDDAAVGDGESQVLT